MPRNLAQWLDDLLAQATEAKSFLVQLGPLTLSAPLVSGAPSTGTISGLSEGSSLVSTIPALSVDADEGTYVFDGSTIGSVSGYLIETRDDVWNSPRATPVDIDPSDIANILGTSTLPASQVDGFTAPANALDARLTALGV
jgi:hypothetical protein